MPIRVTDRWRTPPRGTPEQAMAVFRQWGSFPIGDVEDATKEVYRLCRLVTLDASLLIAHAALETGDRQRGRGFLDKNWATVDRYRDARNRYNIAGMGITDTYDYGYRWAGGIEAARAFVVHHARYEIPPDDPAWRHLDPYIRLDLRFDAVPVANRGTVRTVADMTGKWWTNRDGHINLASRGNQIFPNLPDQGDTAPDPQEDNDMATHRYIISMGHRNTDRGGAYREYDWTPGAARALRDAIKARGGQAWIIQEERGNGNFYNGGLQAAARACVDLARSLGPFDAYISMHYDSSPGFHAIYPNGANDTKAMNPLDVRLCEAMAKRVAATKTVRMKTWTAHAVGVMDEKETYVGSQGYRLGEFVGTLGFRDTTARVITEASGVGDDKYLHDPKWVRNVYAEALVDALEDVFGKFKGTKPEPQPEPEPEPQPEYEKADPIEAVAALPFYVKLDNGAQMVRVDLSVRATTATPRRKWAHAQSPKIGPDIRKGEEFKVDYLIINADGSLYWYTPWATRVALADTEPIFADVDPQEVIDIIKDVLGDNT